MNGSKMSTSLLLGQTHLKSSYYICTHNVSVVVLTESPSPCPRTTSPDHKSLFLDHEVLEKLSRTVHSANSPLLCIT